MNASIIDLSRYIPQFEKEFPEWKDLSPWSIPSNLLELLSQRIKSLGPDYKIQGDVAIHSSAVVEEHVILKGPIIISEGCFIGAHAYLRGGVYLGRKSSIGPGCEVKSSVILNNSALAHFNFVGDSLVGSHINMEAGSIIANHFNERTDKTIHVLIEGKKHKLDMIKFGSIVGDNARIGANAVLSPGTVLVPGSIVKRLELIDQTP